MKGSWTCLVCAYEALGALWPGVVFKEFFQAGDVLQAVTPGGFSRLVAVPKYWDTSSPQSKCNDLYYSIINIVAASDWPRHQR